MRVAGLISGQPRFCKSFDIQLQNLKNDEPIDWFFYLWNNNSPNQNGKSVIPQGLLQSTTKSAKEYIESRLPTGHRLINLVSADTPNTDHITKKNYYRTGWPLPEHVFLMYYGVFLVNQLKTQEEQKYGKYDLVIRTRPDLSLARDLNLHEIKSIIDNNQNIVITPNNNRHGMPPANDQFAIGNSETMDRYANIANCLDNIYNSGVEYGPETLLYHHLKRSNIRDVQYNIEVKLREFYKIENNMHIVDLGTWK